MSTNEEMMDRGQSGPGRIQSLSRQLSPNIHRELEEDGAPLVTTPTVGLSRGLALWAFVATACVVCSLLVITFRPPKIVINNYTVDTASVPGLNKPDSSGESKSGASVARRNQGQGCGPPYLDQCPTGFFCNYDAGLTGSCEGVPINCHDCARLGLGNQAGVDDCNYMCSPKVCMCNAVTSSVDAEFLCEGHGFQGQQCTDIGCCHESNGDCFSGLSQPPTCTSDPRPGCFGGDSRCTGVRTWGECASLFKDPIKADCMWKGEKDTLGHWGIDRTVCAKAIHAQILEGEAEACIGNDSRCAGEQHNRDGCERLRSEGADCLYVSQSGFEQQVCYAPEPGYQLSCGQLIDRCVNIAEGREPVPDPSEALIQTEKFHTEAADRQFNVTSDSNCEQASENTLVSGMAVFFSIFVKGQGHRLAVAFNQIVRTVKGPDYTGQLARMGASAGQSTPYLHGIVEILSETTYEMRTKLPRAMTNWGFVAYALSGKEVMSKTLKTSFKTWNQWVWFGIGILASLIATLSHNGGEVSIVAEMIPLLMEVIGFGRTLTPLIQSCGI